MKEFDNWLINFCSWILIKLIKVILPNTSLRIYKISCLQVFMFISNQNVIKTKENKINRYEYINLDIYLKKSQFRESSQLKYQICHWMYIINLYGIQLYFN